MSTDEAYNAVLAALSDMADQWRIHREVVNRAISLLNHEVVGFVDRLDKDDQSRIARQTDVDIKLAAITRGQDQIRRWQWIRISVEITAVLIVVAFLYGVSR